MSIPQQLYFGSVAIEYGFLSAEHMKQVLAFQNKMKASGLNPPPVGRVAVDLKLLSRHQAELIIAIQKELIEKWKRGEDAAPPPLAQGASQTPAAGDWVQAAPQRSSESAIRMKRETKRRLALRMRSRAAKQRIAFYLGSVVVYVALRVLAAAFAG